MAQIIESASQRMVLQSGSTTLTLDKTTAKGTMQRKLLFWKLRPLELLGEVAGIEVDVGVDRASGIEVCNTMLVTRAGAGWTLPATDKKDAEATAEATAVAMRNFLGLVTS
jgi:hypothetical protein